jgi:dienelactone hydrolase
MRLRWIVPVFYALLFDVESYAAEAAKIELYLLQTTTLTDEQFLTGARDGQPTTIAGELRLPRAGTERFPAMIIVHGSGGIVGGDDRWSRELNEMGIATFLLDGFTGRGIVRVTDDQTQLGNLTMINDAYRALELLAKHPRVDATRIGVIGGSRGARVALYTSLKRFQRMYAAPGTQFAVYLALHSGCYTTYVDDTDVADQPIRLFHGTADDLGSIESCRSYVERLQRAGKDVALTEYVGALHAFDNPVLPANRQLPEIRVSGRACALYEDNRGRILNRETDEPFGWDDRCVQRGGSMGYDPGSHAKVIDDVKAVLKRVFASDSAQ